MHDPVVQHFELTGATWAEKPQVWKNFAMHALDNADNSLTYQEIMTQISNKLAEFDLEQDGNMIMGTPEAIMAWKLTYG
jgi:hypothetical protein